MDIIAILVGILAGIGAGIGVGFASMTSAVVIGPVFITFLHMNPYQAVGIGLACDILASAVGAHAYAKTKAVDLKSGKLVTLSEGSVVDAALASSSMPTVFRPVEKDGGLYVDGSVLCRVPVRQLREMGAQVVVAVDVLGGCKPIEKVPNIIALITRVYETMDSALTSAERRRCRRYVDLWLEPDLGDMVQFTFKKLDFALDAGYALGKEYAPKIRELIGE